MDSDPEFFFNPPENAEDMSCYKPGGYHPVTLGEILPSSPVTGRPRYKILNKLGHGAFATVWLAKKLSGDQ